MYHRLMLKTLSLVIAAALLNGCSWMSRSGSGTAKKNAGSDDSFTVTAPPFVLPGVPLGAARPTITARAPAQPAAVPEEEQPPEAAPSAAELKDVKTASVAAEPNGDLDFHMAAADKYSAKKKYRSAAAEYGAALGSLPSGDARAVYLMERQGAMMLRAGALLKAEGYFSSAIKKAGELNTAGDDLAESYMGLGYCQEKANKVTEAVDSYKKARDNSGKKSVKARLSKTISGLQKK